MFDDFFRGFDISAFANSGRANRWLAPRIDVSESDAEYRFSAEIPGVEDKDVEVTLSDGVLTIKGEKKSETKEEKDHFLRSERHYGAFQRSFCLPSDVDEEKVKASFNQGVLTVTVAKNPKAKSATKRIEVHKAA
jgi:HSP20 family protein